MHCATIAFAVGATAHPPPVFANHLACQRHTTMLHAIYETCCNPTGFRACNLTALRPVPPHYGAVPRRRGNLRGTGWGALRAPLAFSGSRSRAAGWRRRAGRCGAACARRAGDRAYRWAAATRPSRPSLRPSWSHQRAVRLHDRGQHQLVTAGDSVRRVAQPPALLSRVGRVGPAHV
jgi:hypothetical protein